MALLFAYLLVFKTFMVYFRNFFFLFYLFLASTLLSYSTSSIHKDSFRVSYGVRGGQFLFLKGSFHANPKKLLVFNYLSWHLSAVLQLMAYLTLPQQNNKILGRPSYSKRFQLN